MPLETFAAKRGNYGSVPKYGFGEIEIGRSKLFKCAWEDRNKGARAALYQWIGRHPGTKFAVDYMRDDMTKEFWYWPN